MISKTYRFNSKLVQTIKCNYIPWPEDREYEALTGVMQVIESKESVYVHTPSSDEPIIEERKLLYLQKFIDDCKFNNIQLVMCYSPYYGQAISNSICKIEEVAEKNNVPFINYGVEKLFQKTEYFQDAGHLNDVGAHIYSKEIARLLKILMSCKK